MAKFIEYKLDNGKTVRIPQEEVDKSMELLDLTEEDAIQMWLEDEGYVDNAEQIELDKKAKASGLSRTIHEAKSTKERKPREKVRKEDRAKEDVISTLADTLKEFAENVQIVNVGKLITFTLDGDNYKLDLIRQRKPKEK
jgi:wobble nucleotide-excising tRNase